MLSVLNDALFKPLHAIPYVRFTTVLYWGIKLGTDTYLPHLKIDMIFIPFSVRSSITEKIAIFFYALAMPNETV